MASKRVASADATTRGTPPGPFLQRRGMQEAEEQIEPQEVVRARIEDIELQIAQLEQKREALQGITQVVSGGAVGGAEPQGVPSGSGVTPLQAFGVESSKGPPYAKPDKSLVMDEAVSCLGPPSIPNLTQQVWHHLIRKLSRSP